MRVEPPRTGLVPYERDLAELSNAFSYARTWRGGTVYNPRREVSPETEPAGDLGQTSQPPEQREVRSCD